MQAYQERDQDGSNSMKCKLIKKAQCVENTKVKLAFKLKTTNARQAENVNKLKLEGLIFIVKDVIKKISYKSANS